jgi:hypothetical protein
VDFASKTEENKIVSVPSEPWANLPVW